MFLRKHGYRTTHFLNSYYYHHSNWKLRFRIRLKKKLKIEWQTTEATQSITVRVLPYPEVSPYIPKEGKILFFYTWASEHWSNWDVSLWCSWFKLHTKHKATLYLKLCWSWQQLLSPLTQLFKNRLSTHTKGRRAQFRSVHWEAHLPWMCLANE